MKLYLLTQTERTGYDTYDSCVVIASNEEEAKLIHPDDDYKYRSELNSWLSDYWYNKYLTNLISTDRVEYYISNAWCKYPEQVTAKYIGEFKGNLDDYPGRVICASFNAG